jgi:hypothetical protein
LFTGQSQKDRPQHFPICLEVKDDEDQNAAATKGDLAQLRSEMSHGYNDILERIADSETRLLKAFYAFAESNDKRMTLSAL